MSLGSPSRIRALAMAPLRRLALSVLFTIATTSYQTTCTVSERSSIKGTRQCKPTQYRLFALQHREQDGHNRKQECAPVGCVPSDAVAVSGRGGWWFCRGGGGVSAWGGVVHTTPCEQNDRQVYKITFPQLLLRTVTMVPCPYPCLRVVCTVHSVI